MARIGKKRKIPFVVPTLLTIALVFVLFLYTVLTVKGFDGWQGNLEAKAIGILFFLTPFFCIAGMVGVWIYWLKDRVWPIYGFFSVPGLWWVFIASLNFYFIA